MSSEISIFSNPQFGQIRTVLIDNEPYFVARDVALALGYKNTNEAISHHVDDGVARIYPILDALGRTQKASVIPESEVYSLIFGSSLPSAKEFSKWVKREVLPSIRKTGSYNQVHPVQLPDLKKEIEGIEAVCSFLNLSNQSKKEMAAISLKKHGCAEHINALPYYSTEGVQSIGGGTSTRIKHSLSVLLKKHDIPISARKVNAILVEKGVLVKKERLSSSGKMKPDGHQLTENYKHLGELLSGKGTSTQLHFFEDTFCDVLELIE